MFMGQLEVLHIFKKGKGKKKDTDKGKDTDKPQRYRGWKTKKEIADDIPELSDSGISMSLKRLVNGGIIERKRCDDMKHGYLYRLKPNVGVKIEVEDDEDDEED